MVRKLWCRFQVTGYSPTEEKIAINLSSDLQLHSLYGGAYHLGIQPQDSGQYHCRTLQKFIQHHSVEESGVFVSSLFVNQQVQSMDFSLIPVGEIENSISWG
jgi:hypothetical protein